jgi:pilus assembly protein CpaE
MREATVLLGVGDPGLQDEVLDYLDRRPAVRVVAAAADPEGIERSLRQRRPDAMVATPDLAGTVPSADARLLVVDRRETTEALRNAIRAGARGFYLWPDERDVLGAEAEAASRSGDVLPAASGSVVAVYPGRGGAGGTFLATNLAAAFARVGTQAMLADLDVVHGDVASVLAHLDAPGSIQDLAPVADELGPEHVDRVAATHPLGFRVLTSGTGGESLPDGLSAGAVSAMRRSFGVTVLHLPRSVDEAVRTSVRESDVVLVVVTLDVQAVRAAQRALDRLDDGGLPEKSRLVVNRATRGEIVPADAAEALGIPIAAVSPFDCWVGRAPTRGAPGGPRAAPPPRRVTRLARSLLQDIGAAV